MAYRRRYPVKKKPAPKKKTPPRPLLSPYTRDELMKIVQSEVDLEIDRATDPLEEAATRFGTRRASAVGELGTLYSSLQPFVSGAAERLGSFAGQAREDERALFADASARLQSLSANRAAEAQGLAQTLGANIPLSTFDQATSQGQGELAATSAGDQLAAAMGGTANVEAAEAFAGRVFPGMRAQQQQEITSRFDEQITGLEKEIAEIKSQRGKAIDARFAERLIAEREFALAKLQADRDFNIARQTLGLERGQLTGTYRGKPTLAAKQLAEQRRQFTIGTRIEQQRWREEMTLQVEQLRQQAMGAKTQQGADNSAMRMSAFALATALTSPSDPKTYRVSEWIPAQEGSAGAVEVPPGSGRWLKMTTVTKRVPRGKPIRGPALLYKVMIQQGIPKAIARNVVNTRFGRNAIDAKGRLRGAPVRGERASG